MHLTTTGARAVLGAAVLFSALVVPTAVVAASAGSDDSRAKSSATKKIKKLSKQVKALQQQVDALELQPGPQGPQGAQGPAGTAPACQGNDANDKMVTAGSACVDRYEASAWSSPTGGTQYGATSDDYPCDDNGQNCIGANAIYARSVAGVTPSRFMTYFQAQQALANSGKRLATNAEWQMAAAGTTDLGASPGSEDCNTNSAGLDLTGERANCKSNYGANDMAGNLDEWVADWDEQSTGGCSAYGGTFNGDRNCFGDFAAPASPGPLTRGGDFNDAALAGAFAADVDTLAVNSDDEIGFRGAR